ncbi:MULTISPECIES: hypothetical protein [unclassified Streptomyces]|uniref:hypothetical protein n=1 Tax=unclassified Streptomyces TaxID=2593676 RepID=UPI00109EDA6E|nr:hypothetical protein [Streptomyces sp. A1136]THA58249.1 hypothetical protein E6R62_03495 [Streptomyces sp. A1136]
MDRMSPAASALIHHALRGRAPDLAVRLALYRAFLDRPGDRLLLAPSTCPACPGCALDDIAVVRDELADLYRGLPPEARSALGRVLRTLDAGFRRRTLPDPAPVAVGRDRSGRPLPWWHRRLYEGT